MQIGDYAIKASSALAEEELIDLLKYREGVFDTKGIIEGNEYYSSGQLKFAGIWKKHGAYGPKYPVMGNYFSEDGDLIFSGKFDVKRGGVGYPMMKYPKYRFEEKDRPKIDYL